MDFVTTTIATTYLLERINSAYHFMALISHEISTSDGSMIPPCVRMNENPVITSKHSMAIPISIDQIIAKQSRDLQQHVGQNKPLTSLCQGSVQKQGHMNVEDAIAG